MIFRFGSDSWWSVLLWMKRGRHYSIELIPSLFSAVSVRLHYLIGIRKYRTVGIPPIEIVAVSCFWRSFNWYWSRGGGLAVYEMGGV